MAESRDIAVEFATRFVEPLFKGGLVCQSCRFLKPDEKSVNCRLGMGISKAKKKGCRQHGSKGSE